MDVSSDTWTLVTQLSPRRLVVPRVPASHQPAFPRETSLLLELDACAHGICLTPDPDPRATVCPLRVESHLTECTGRPPHHHLGSFRSFEFPCTFQNNVVNFNREAAGTLRVPGLRAAEDSPPPTVHTSLHWLSSG